MQKFWKPIIGTFLQLAVYGISFYMTRASSLSTQFLEIDPDTGIAFADNAPTWFLIVYLPTVLLSIGAYWWQYLRMRKPLPNERLAARTPTALVTSGVMLVLFATLSFLAAWILGRITAIGLYPITAASATMVFAAQFIAARYLSPLPN